jgi:hypothetical protein
MIKQRKSVKKEQSDVLFEIQAQIAHLIEILDRIEHRLSGGF